MVQEINPKVVSNDENVEEIYFDLTLIVDKQNGLTVIDNTQEDFYDYLDCGTLTCQQVKIRV